MRCKTLVTAGVVFSALMAVPLSSQSQVFGGAKNLFPGLWAKSQKVVKTGEFAREIEKIQKDTERDHYLSAQQAKEYGLIDKVILPNTEKKND